MGRLTATQDGASYASKTIAQGETETGWNSYTLSYKGLSQQITYGSITSNSMLYFPGDPLIPQTGELIIARINNDNTVYRGSIGQIVPSVPVDFAIKVGVNELAAILAPEDLAFNNDGTKLFIVSSSEAKVYQFALGVPFDLTSVVYSDEAMSLRPQDRTPCGIIFNPAGTRMYITGATSGSIYQYALSIAFDISSAVYNSVTISVSEETAPRSIAFDNTGANLFVVGSENDTIFQYTVSDPFDLASTITYTQNSFNLSAQDSTLLGPWSIVFNNNGTRLYMSGDTNNSIFQYSLLTAYDITTMVFDEASFEFTSQDKYPRGIAFNANQSKMFMVGRETRSVYQYSVNSTIDTSTIDTESVLTRVSVDISSLGLPNVPSAVYYDNLPRVFTSWDADEEKLRAEDRSLVATASTFTRFTADTPERPISAVFGELITPFTDTGSLLVTVPVDVSSATYTGKEFSITNETYDPRAIRFDDTGSRLFMLAGGNIIQYSLSSPYDITTMQYDNKMFYTGSQDYDQRGFIFSLGGTRLHTVGRGSERVSQYTLSTAYDLQSTVYTGTNLYLGSSADGMDIAFNNDGTKMFILTARFDRVEEYTLSTPFDITNAVLNNTFAVGSQESQPEAIAFNSDGSRMYCMGGSTDSVYQYILSTPFDITTANYDNNFLFIGNEENNAHTMIFSQGGSNMFVVGRGAYRIRQFSLPGITVGTSSIIYDEKPKTILTSAGVINRIQSVTYDSESFNIAQDQLPAGVTFSPDGARMFVAGDSSDDLFQYDLSLPFEVSSAVYNNVSVNVGNFYNVYGVNKVVFNINGTKMYVLDSGYDNVLQFSLPSAYNLNGASHDSKQFNASGQDSLCTGMAINDAGTKMLLLGSSSNALYQYSLTTPFDISTAGYDSISFSLAGQLTDAKDIAVLPDGSQVFVLSAAGIVYQYNMLTAFDASTITFDSVLIEVSSQDSEMSGIAFASNYTKFYAVGRNTDAVYQYSMNVTSNYEINYNELTYNPDKITIRHNATQETTIKKQQWVNNYVETEFATTYDQAGTKRYLQFRLEFDANTEVIGVNYELTKDELE